MGTWNKHQYITERLHPISNPDDVDQSCTVWQACTHKGGGNKVQFVPKTLEKFPEVEEEKPTLAVWLALFQILKKKGQDHVYFAHPIATNQNLDSITGYAMNFTDPHTIIPDTLSPILHFLASYAQNVRLSPIPGKTPKTCFSQTKPAYLQLIRVIFWKIQHTVMKDGVGQQCL